MSVNQTTEGNFSGEYMVQDRDHLSQSNEVSPKAKRGVAPQSEQSQADAGQQGVGDQRTSKQRGGERRQPH